MGVQAELMIQAAEQLKSEIIAYRRALHQQPEVGAYLPNTKEFVKKALSEMGYAPIEICESGIVATITGKNTGRCILLRADMDALAIKEQTDLPFRSENGKMHACGHDMHTSMLLGAARLLKTYQSELKGTVKLVFQPDEEGFTGAKAML
ncbi:M20/M25/M40 family metallo-hydrolase, partial [Blautia pseudococcoides]|nr:M20/M25/M40 family metallo-hydrolase [Blautia pseudococcoides]